jgi:hypothetical protein
MDDRVLKQQGCSRLWRYDYFRLKEENGLASCETFVQVDHRFIGSNQLPTPP